VASVPKVAENKELAEFAERNGFASAEEYETMIAQVDLTRPGMSRGFDAWKENPTKDGLKKLLGW
jgi:hypothetical protein